MRVETVPDPRILNPHEALVKITSTAIYGSDLHLYDAYIPSLMKGDILGHEFMGEVVEVGSQVKNLKAGNRVVVPFTISCGNCFFCKKGLWSACDNSNPNAWIQEKAYTFGLPKSDKKQPNEGVRGMKVEGEASNLIFDALTSLGRSAANRFRQRPGPVNLEK